MKRLRFILIGGFLGAGKTTAMARLARHYAARGQRVGLVTNDQAQDLVDTNSLRAQGFAVEEVAGACFCCRFDDLVGKVGKLQTGERPDVILAEPVGSCTDLVATVVQPLRDLYGERFEVAPYAVLFKPEPRPAHPPQRIRVRLLAQSGLHLPQTARRSRRRRPQSHRRNDAGSAERAGRIDGERISGNAGAAHVGEDRPGLRRADRAARPAGRLRPKDPRHRLRHLCRGRGRAGLAERGGRGPRRPAVRPGRLADAVGRRGCARRSAGWARKRDTSR